MVFAKDGFAFVAACHELVDRTFKLDAWTSCAVRREQRQRLFVSAVKGRPQFASTRPQFRLHKRWLYSTCLVFALPLAEHEKTRFRYSCSPYQAGYGRNHLFRCERHMEPLFEALIERTRVSLDLPTVKTIFGSRRRPYFRNEQGKLPRCERAVEKPA